MESKRARKEKQHAVMLKPETFARLDAYKAKVIGERKTSKVSFDDIINSLLDISEERRPIQDD